VGCAPRFVPTATPSNSALEPSRLPSCAIMAMWRAAQRVSLDGVRSHMSTMARRPLEPVRSGTAHELATVRADLPGWVLAFTDRAIARLSAMAVVAGTAAAVTAAATEPVDLVLTRAAAYVAAYEQGLGSVIADERYRQDVSFPAAADDPVGGAARLLGNPIRRRDLRSEFLLLRAPGPLGLWLGLRDVLYVDGRPAPDRAPLQPRLPRDAAVSDKVFERLVNESARYNIGRVTRNVNVPTFALLLARASVQSRFSFEKREERTVAGTRAWALAFEEQATPTLIRGSAGSDLPATGIIWVDPTSGRIIQTELITDEPLTHVRTKITVKYRPNSRLGIWVPVEMTESYRIGPANSFAAQNIDCVATYSNFRRFEVDVKLRVPAGL
jgi:hypothetical protein